VCSVVMVDVAIVIAADGMTKNAPSVGGHDFVVVEVVVSGAEDG
jgi:hypothetical protein